MQKHRLRRVGKILFDGPQLPFVYSGFMIALIVTTVGILSTIAN